jgi:hypothetical protein
MSDIQKAVSVILNHISALGQNISSYNNLVGGVCPLADSLRSFRLHKGWTQLHMSHVIQDGGVVIRGRPVPRWFGNGYKCVSGQTISDLETGKKSFNSTTIAYGEVNRCTLKEALDDCFGKEWRKTATPVRQHNRVK